MAKSLLVPTATSSSSTRSNTASVPLSLSYAPISRPFTIFTMSKKSSPVGHHRPRTMLPPTPPSSATKPTSPTISISCGGSAISSPASYGLWPGTSAVKRFPTTILFQPMTRYSVFICVVSVAFAALASCKATKTATTNLESTQQTAIDRNLDATIQIIRHVPSLSSPSSPSPQSVPTDARPSAPSLPLPGSVQHGSPVLFPSFCPDTTTIRITASSSSSLSDTLKTSSTTTQTKSHRVGEGLKNGLTAGVETIVLVLVGLLVILIGSFCLHLYYTLRS